MVMKVKLKVRREERENVEFWESNQEAI